MQAVMKEKSSIIEWPKHDWHAAFVNKRLCYRRATAGTFILNLSYSIDDGASKDSFVRGCVINGRLDCLEIHFEPFTFFNLWLVSRNLSLI